MSLPENIRRAMLRPDTLQAQSVKLLESVAKWHAQPLLTLTFTGQIRGGKNNMIVTRKGLHFPKPEWAKWRDAAVAQIRAQLPFGFAAYDQPLTDEIDYYAGDKRRRDRPAVLDAVWHVLEKAGVVTDDTLLRDSIGYRVHYDKSNPRLIIHLRLA